MRKFIYTFLLLLLTLVSDLFAGFILDSNMKRIVVAFMNQQYTRARSDIAAILRADPADIDALFMKVNAGQIEIVDYESYVIEGYRFIHSVDTILAIIEGKMKSSTTEEQIRYLFYIGTIYGMKSLVYAKLEDWLKAVKYARMSVKFLEMAREKDPSFLETLYGIGLYNYYLGENLKWLPFMRGKSLKGLADIESVAYSVSPLNFMAKNSLAWIYVEREDFDKADAVVTSVLKTYPCNTIFLRIQARVALFRKDYKKAEKLGKRMVVLSQKRRPVNWSDLIDAYQIVVASQEAMGKYKECMQNINAALNLKVPASAKKIEYVKKHLEYIAMRKTQIRNKL